MPKRKPTRLVVSSDDEAESGEDDIFSATSSEDEGIFYNSSDDEGIVYEQANVIADSDDDDFVNDNPIRMRATKIRKNGKARVFEDVNPNEVDVFEEVHNLPDIQPNVIPSYNFDPVALEKRVGNEKRLVLDHEADDVTTQVVRDESEDPLAYHDRGRNQPVEAWEEWFVDDEAKEGYSEDEEFNVELALANAAKKAEDGDDDAASHDDALKADDDLSELTELSDQLSLDSSHWSSDSSTNSIYAPKYNTKINRVPLKNYDCKTSRRLLRDYQKKPSMFAQKMHKSSDGMLIIQKAGAGKTLTGLTIIEDMMTEELENSQFNEPTPWIILCTPNLAKQWISELEDAYLCNVETYPGERGYMGNLAKYKHLVKVISNASEFSRFSDTRLHNSYLLFDEVQVFRYNKPKPPKVKKTDDKGSPTKKGEGNSKKPVDDKSEKPDETDEIALNPDEEEDAENDMPRLLKVVGAAAKTKKAFLLTATPIYGRKTEMATYYWILKRNTVPTLEELETIANQIASERIRETYERWKCLITFHLSMEDDPSIPGRLDIRIEVPFSETEDERYQQFLNTNVRTDRFYNRENELCISNTKLERIMGLCGSALAIDQAKIIILSRNVRNSAQPLGLSRLRPYLNTAYPNEYLDLSLINTDIETRRAVVAFNEGETYIPLQRIPNRTSEDTDSTYRRKISRSDRDYTKIKQEWGDKGPARILLLGPKHSVGTDLKGVTHVILMEPAWFTPHTTQQVGRAIRRNALSMITNVNLMRANSQGVMLPFVRVYHMIATRRMLTNPHQEKFDLYRRKLAKLGALTNPSEIDKHHINKYNVKITQILRAHPNIRASDWEYDLIPWAEDPNIRRPAGYTSDQLKAARSTALKENVDAYMRWLKEFQIRAGMCF